MINLLHTNYSFYKGILFILVSVWHNTALELLGSSTVAVTTYEAPTVSVWHNTALEPYVPSTVAVTTYESLTVVGLGGSNTVPVP